MTVVGIQIPATHNRGGAEPAVELPDWSDFMTQRLDEDAGRAGRPRRRRRRRGRGLTPEQKAIRDRKTGMGYGLNLSGDSNY